MTLTYTFDKSRGPYKQMPLLMVAALLAITGTIWYDLSAWPRGAIIGLAALVLAYAASQQRETGKFIERIVNKDGAIYYYLFADTARGFPLPPGAARIVVKKKRIEIRNAATGKIIALANRDQLYGKRDWDELAEMLGKMEN